MFRGLSVVIFVVGAIIGVGFAMLRYQLLDAYLPKDLLQAMEDMRAASPAEVEVTPKREVAVPQDGPGKHLVDSPEGLRAEGPIAAMAGNRPILIDDVIAGYAPTSDSGVPATVTAIRPISGCRPTPPAEGTVVGHVTAGSSGLRLPFSTYDDGDLAWAVQAFVDAVRAGDMDPAASLRGPDYEAYDVAVTETRAPVLLVLEGRAGNRIWNIHSVEGVRIERVILLGGGQAGVANLDPVVPVEVMLDDGLADCGIRPAYLATRGQAATGGENVAELDEAARAYDIWFRDSFGVLASETRAGFDVGTISVVGPVPMDEEPKPDYSPVHGADLRATQSTYFDIVGQVANGEDFAARVKAIATTFAFGDLNYLRQGVSF
jgi:hypothetical protein